MRLSAAWRAVLAIADANISRRHCVISRREDGYFIVDLASTHGIEFNGQRVNNHRIEEGAIYYVAGHKLRFSFTPAVPPPASGVCTEMPCSDTATIQTKMTAAGAPVGRHEFAIEVDAVVQTCTVGFTGTPRLVYAICSAPGTSLWFGPVMRGVDTPVEVDGKGVVMHSEEPVAGQFMWQLSLFGTPAKAHVVHRHAGKVLLDQTAEFGTYGEYRPNGEGCEPVCKQASVEWKRP